MRPTQDQGGEYIKNEVKAREPEAGNGDGRQRENGKREREQILLVGVFSQRQVGGCRRRLIDRRRVMEMGWLRWRDSERLAVLLG